MIGKLLSDYAIYIYNWCIRTEYFPLKQKYVTVIMIPTQGKDMLNPVNHRPISFLNSLSKVLERLLLVTLKTWTINHTHPKQYGYPIKPLHHHSTSKCHWWHFNQLISNAQDNSCVQRSWLGNKCVFHDSSTPHTSTPLTTICVAVKTSYPLEAKFVSSSYTRSSFNLFKFKIN